MSFHIYRIDKFADKERLLKEKLKMESQIRRKRESKRKQKTITNQKYSQIFEPVTQTIKELAVKQPVPIIEETKPVEEQKEEIEEKPDELYLQAVQSIPYKESDDGLFGLSPANIIGNNTYHVNGKTLTTINKSDGTVKKFTINNKKLWQLLLVKKPKVIGLNLMDDEGKEALKEYRNIVEELHLIDDARMHVPHFKNRAKFKLLEHGSGFMFSTRPPFHPSTIVIPSDKKGLLRALVKAVAELRAGNTSMQNIVVPLAQEAKRKKILPHNLLSPDEMTWIYA